MRSDEVPALDCLVRGHILVSMVDGQGLTGSYCVWCGTAVHDPEFDFSTKQVRDD